MLTQAGMRVSGEDTNTTAGISNYCMAKRRMAFDAYGGFQFPIGLLLVTSPFFHQRRTLNQPLRIVLT